MTETTALTYFDELITEVEICRRYRHLLSERELRTARQNQEITFTSGKRGIVLYHPDDVAAYLKRKEVPCLDYGNTADTGSGTLTIPESSMPTGTTSERDQRVADHLVQKYSRSPRKSSSRSSAPRNRTEAARPHQ